MTASARKKSLEPFRMLALTTASLTFGAMPTMPIPFDSAAITPATFEPWPESSTHEAGSRFGLPPTQETLRDESMLPSRSGWLGSTPVSITPTSTFGLPPVILWASGALIRCEYHWSGENVSSSVAGKLGRPWPSQPQPEGVATTLPTGATPSTSRFRSSFAAKPGSSDSAMTTSICG